MALDLVTAAIMDLLKNSLRAQPAVPEDAFTVTLASPDEGAGEADLSLFLYLVTPAPELRNADRIRPWPTATDVPRLLEPAVPIELHFLVTLGKGAPSGAPGLSRLADAIRAIESGSPLVVPDAFQSAVWLSLLPLTSDEMARIWGLFPNENCRSSFAFRASPVWIDPREAPPVAAPVSDDQSTAGRMLENAA